MYNMVKLQHDANGQYKITLPKSIIEAKRWKKGDSIKILFNKEGNMILMNQNESKKN